MPEENLENKKWVKLGLEILVLTIFLIFGFYLYLLHLHNLNLRENIVSQETLKEVQEGLPKKIELNIENKIENLSDKKILENQKDTNENENKNAVKNTEKIKYNEERLFEFLSLENQPKFLDNLMKDLIIKNNSTTTIEETCNGQDLLEKDECKKSLFIGCSEALFLKFALVNECTQFAKNDYVNYLKAKKTILQNQGRQYFKPKPIMTEVGEIAPSQFILSKEDLKDTIDSSILNNDFTKNEDENETVNIVNDLETTPGPSLSGGEGAQSASNKKVLSNLIGSLTGVITKYTGWVQGWATMFATNGGRHEAGFKMYKTTAFGFNPYHPKNCLISLPYKTVDKFFGTNLNYCVKTKNINCIFSDKEKVKGKPIEFFMIKNGQSAIFPLGDLGPAEWTGNAADLNSCAAKKLGASGKDQVRFRVAR